MRNLPSGWGERANTTPQLHEELVNDVQPASAVKACETFRRVVAIVSQVAHGLFRLAYVGERMDQPLTLPFPITANVANSAKFDKLLMNKGLCNR